MMRLFLVRMVVMCSIVVLRQFCLTQGIDITPTLAMVALMMAMVPYRPENEDK